MAFEVNDNINLMVSLCQGDIIMLCTNARVNIVCETLLGGGFFN